MSGLRVEPRELSRNRNRGNSGIRPCLNWPPPTDFTRDGCTEHALQGRTLLYAIPQNRNSFDVATTDTPACYCVVLDAAGCILLIQRKNEPFKGLLALPGGFVDIGEKIEDACRRELLEETGVEAGELKLVGVYSDPKRDPRGHVSSVVFFARIDHATPPAGDDAAEAEWFADPEEQRLAFDHRDILRDALKLA